MRALVHAQAISSMRAILVEANGGQGSSSKRSVSTDAGPRSRVHAAQCQMQITVILQLEEVVTWVTEPHVTC